MSLFMVQTRSRRSAERGSKLRQLSPLRAYGGVAHEWACLWDDCHPSPTRRRTRRDVDPARGRLPIQLGALPRNLAAHAAAQPQLRLEQRAAKQPRGLAGGMFPELLLRTFTTAPTVTFACRVFIFNLSCNLLCVLDLALLPRCCRDF